MQEPPPSTSVRSLPGCPALPAMGERPPFSTATGASCRRDAGHCSLRIPVFGTLRPAQGKLFRSERGGVWSFGPSGPKGLRGDGAAHAGAGEGEHRQVAGATSLGALCCQCGMPVPAVWGAGGTVCAVRGRINAGGTRGGAAGWSRGAALSPPALAPKVNGVQDTDHFGLDLGRSSQTGRTEGLYSQLDHPVLSLPASEKREAAGAVRRLDDD